MKKLILAFALLPLCALAQQTFSSNKEYLLISNTKMNKIYLHTPSIEYADDERLKMMVWVSITPKTKQAYSWWMGNLGIDCGVKRIKTLSRIAYDKRNQIIQEDDEQSSWQVPVPNSVGYDAMIGACAYNKP